MEAKKKFFHQQLFGLYFLFLLILSLLFGSAIFFNQLKEIQLNAVLGDKVPNLEKTLKQQSTLQQAEKAIAQLISLKTANNAKPLDEQLSQSLQQLNEQLTEPAEQTFIYLKEQQAQNILRVVNNDVRNNQLKQYINEQLRLTSTMAASLITLKNERAQALYKLFKNETVKDDITASRVIAYANLITSTQGIEKALNLIQLIQINLIPLNLQSAEKSLDELENHSNALFLWFKQFQQNNEPESAELIKQLTKLEKLLLTDERLIAKWRGHLRLYNEYQKLLLAQQTQLSEQAELLVPINQVNKALPLTLPTWLVTLFDKWQIKVAITNQQLQQVLLIVMLACAVLFIMVLMLINRRVKSFAGGTVKLVNKLLADEKIKVKAAEQQHIVNVLTDIVKPKFSEHDYYALQKEQQNQLSFLTKQHQVAFWQLNNATSIKNALTLVSKLTGKTGKTIRSYFTKSELTHLLESARLVKKSQQPVALNFSDIDGNLLHIVLDYQQGWQGSVAYQTNTNQVEKEEVLIDLASDQYEHYYQFTFAFINKVIKAMLQSQAECLTQKLPNASLYKQLSRLLTWGEQSKLLAELGANEFQLELNQVCLQDKIVNALSQVSLDIKSQKCYPIFYDKLPHLCQIETDETLFNNLIINLANLMLAQQRHANLLLTLWLSDKNAGQYIVSYQFDLLVKNPLEQIPDIVLTLAEEHNNHEIGNNAHADLCKKILQKLHVQGLHFNKTEQGYSLHFDLPHTRILSANEQLTKADLSDKNIVLLGDNVQQNRVVQKYLQELGANIEECNLDKALSLLSVEKLKIQKVDLVLVLPEHNNQSLVQIEQQLALVELLPPKLMVLPSPHIRLNQHKAIYNQTSVPLHKVALQKHVAQLLTAKQPNNRVISAEEVNAQAYLYTGIELLLAVENIVEHQVLLQQLQVLGFNITLASSSNEMQALWHTGKYLVLISEYHTSPLIELANGKQVKRGVFNFSSEHQQKWLVQAENSHWQIGVIPLGAPFSELAVQLAPWLVLQSVSEQIHAVMPVAKATETKVKTDQAIAFEDLPAAFDLTAYSQKLTGPELAILLLDDYLAELETANNKLTYALSVKALEQVNQQLTIINNHAKVLSAQPLLNAVKALQTEIAHRHYHNAQEKLLQVKDEIIALIAYAEAI